MQRRMQPFEERENLVLGGPVEGGQGLVHEQQARLREQGAPHGHTLALTAGQMMGRPAQKVGEAEKAHHLVERNGRVLQASRRAIEQVAPHREVGEEAGFLKHIAHRPLVGGAEGACVLPHPPATAQRPGRRFRPATQRSTVVLPQPEGPNRAVTPVPGQ